MTDVPALRPTQAQVQSQYERAEQMVEYLHRKGRVLNGGRQTVLGLNILVSGTAGILALLLWGEHYRVWGGILAAVVAIFSVVATQLTPKRAADTYELEDAWRRHGDVVLGLLGHIDDRALTDAQAAALYEQIVRTRTELDHRGIDAIRDESAKLPTVHPPPPKPEPAATPPPPRTMRSALKRLLGLRREARRPGAR